MQAPTSPSLGTLPVTVLCCEDFPLTRARLKEEGEGCLPPGSVFWDTADFSEIPGRVRELSPDLLVLDLHNEDGLSGLEVLSRLIDLAQQEPQLRLPKVLIYSGEHAAEIRDFFALRLQALRENGQRASDQVPVFIASKQDDFATVIRAVLSRDETLCYQELSALRDAVSEAVKNERENHAVGSATARALEQQAAEWVLALKRFLEQLQESPLGSTPAFEQLKGCCSLSGRPSQDSFIAAERLHGSIASPAHLYRNFVIWFTKAAHTVLEEPSVSGMHGKTRALLLQTSDFAEALEQCRGNTGFNARSLGKQVLYLLGERDGHRVEVIHPGLRHRLQMPFLLTDVVTELVRNSIKAYGSNREGRVHIEICPVGSARIPTELGELKLEKGEHAVELSIRDASGGFRIPVEEALLPGTSTFGTSGSGLAFLQEFIAKTRALYCIESQEGVGTCIRIFVPAIEEPMLRPRSESSGKQDEP